MLDIDTTVKPVYGHQEGAEIGCNPLRKGRPSMAIHTYQPGVKRLVQELAGRQGWAEAGQGWQAAEAELQLSGWGRKRRLAGKQLELGFEQGELVLGEEPVYEYSVLVTSLEYEARAVAQLYRDRGDMENAVDELKNQWGWGGFVTQDLKRTRIMARMNALFYNWWSLFVRLISPEARREAQTSRPKMLAGVGRVTRHGRQKKLLLTIAHAASRGLRAAFEALARFLREIQNAPQLSAVERWCRILSRACLKYLGGRILKPPPGLLPA